MKNPFAFAFDLETTGLPTEGGAVMPGIYNLYGEIWNLEALADGPVDSIQLWLKVNKDRKWSDFSLQNVVHNKVLSVVDGQVVYNDDRPWVEPAEGLTQLQKMLNHYCTTDGGRIYRPVPLGHNVARFDVPVLARAVYETLGVELDTLMDYHAIDTCVAAFMDLVVVNQAIPFVSLNRVAPFFGIVNPAAHDAKADVQTTMQVFQALADRLRSK